MTTELKPAAALEIWRRALTASVRRESADLSARQMSALLTVYLRPGPHTVRGLAKELNISKPAVTRALDRLGALKLIKRRADDQDKRSVLVQRTPEGTSYLSEFAGLIVRAAKVLK